MSVLYVTLIIHNNNIKMYTRANTPHNQVSAGLVPDGRHFVSRARDEASSWRGTYKAPIPIASLANRMGSYVQAYTLYSSVRPFGITAIVGGFDAETEVDVDGAVGSGPSVGSGGKTQGVKEGGPYLYMIEPSGMYWGYYGAATARAARRRRRSWRS